METIGTLEQLVTIIFEAYDELYHDDEIATLATAATLNELFYIAVIDDRPPAA